MLAMAIKAISVAGMGRFFMDKKEVSKMATAYEDVSQRLNSAFNPQISVLIFFMFLYHQRSIFNF